MIYYPIGDACDFFSLPSPISLQVKLESTVVDYYRLLSVSRTASTAEIKAAYHRALLASHPDKQSCGTGTSHCASADIALIKTAYTTLSSSHSRAQYDAQLEDQLGLVCPRPAQVISLEDFEQDITCEGAAWRYGCRCGGSYRINDEDMEDGRHLIGCGECSEVIWVGYELVQEVE